jgi:chromosome segregation ATPase
MKQFQQNLLIVLALGLCGLCAYQWYQQTEQRGSINTLEQRIYQAETDIQNDTNSIANLNVQVNQLDTSLTAAKAEAATNQELAVNRQAEITRLELIGGGLTNEIEQYKQAVDAMQARLKEAYAGIEKQNEAITNLVGQRDDFVKRYNDEVKERNDVVAKYNDLAKQVEKLQAGATNSSAQ